MSFLVMGSKYDFRHWERHCKARRQNPQSKLYNWQFLHFSAQWIFSSEANGFLVITALQRFQIRSNRFKVAETLLRSLGMSQTILLKFTSIEPVCVSFRRPVRHHRTQEKKVVWKIRKVKSVVDLSTVMMAFVHGPLTVQIDWRPWRTERKRELLLNGSRRQLYVRSKNRNSW